MPSHRNDTAVQQRVLTAMIVNTQVLSSISSIWERKMFSSPWANEIGNWCVDYFQKYKKAPQKTIARLFDSWAKEQEDESHVKLVEKFLSRLDDNFRQQDKEINVEFAIDEASQLFTRVRLRTTAETVLGHLDRGKTETAETALNQFRTIEIGQGSVFDPMRDEKLIDATFASHTGDNILVEYPEPLNSFLRPSFERDAFIAFMAGEKQGKSHTLLDLAWRAALGRRRTLFIASGDLSQSQVMRRLMIRASRHPWEACTVQYPMSITRLKDVSDGLPFEIDFKTKEYTHDLTPSRARVAFQNAVKSHIKSQDPYLKMSVHVAGTLSVTNVEEIVEKEVMNGWVPDVLVLDYADVLAAPRPKMDLREATNETWLRLRGLSQRLHGLVVTATQADAASYGQSVMRRKNFSDDKRKLAHVTGLIGIISTPEEKEMGVSRWNWLVRRESGYAEHRCCFVASCLALCNPVVRSAL